jgi:hypothetical protein
LLIEPAQEERCEICSLLLLLMMMMMMMMNEEKEEEDYGYMTIVFEDDDPCVWDLAGVWNSVHLKLLQQ